MAKTVTFSIPWQGPWGEWSPLDLKSAVEGISIGPTEWRARTCIVDVDADGRVTTRVDIQVRSETELRRAGGGSGGGTGCLSPPTNCPDDWPGYGSFHCGWCAAKAALATPAESRPSSPPERPIPAGDAPRVPTVLVDGIPRRNRVELRTRAETAITEAMWAVENAGADPLLTDAVNLLDRAREKVAEFVDAAFVDTRPVAPPSDPSAKEGE